MTSGKERALALLSTAKNMESPEDMRSLIDSATVFLRDEPELVPGLRLTADMIYAGLNTMVQNLPDVDDDLSIRAEKIAICEASLLQIVDYAKSGLKARQIGSMECAEGLKHQQMNHSLQDFGEARVSLPLRKTPEAA